MLWLKPFALIDPSSTDQMPRSALGCPKSSKVEWLTVSDPHVEWHGEGLAEKCRSHQIICEAAPAADFFRHRASR